MLDVGIASWAMLTGAAIGAVLGVLLGALLLRSSCDLCGLDPSPGFLRCIAVTLVLTVMTSPIGFGIGYGMGLIAASLHWSETAAKVLAVIANLPIHAAISTGTFVIAFRVSVLKALLIWLINLLLSILVWMVLVLILIGILTIIGGTSRLF